MSALLPCPSFPWLFCFHQGKPQNLPRIFFPCRTQKPLEKNKRRHPFLVAPYCAIPRDYLSDTPLLRAMGYLAFPPWRACEVEVRYPPLKRGISAILARYPIKTRQMGVIPPSAILSRKGIARYGGVSRTGLLSTHFSEEIPC